MPGLSAAATALARRCADWAKANPPWMLAALGLAMLEAASRAVRLWAPSGQAVPRVPQSPVPEFFDLNGVLDFFWAFALLALAGCLVDAGYAAGLLRLPGRSGGRAWPRLWGAGDLVKALIVFLGAQACCETAWNVAGLLSLAPENGGGWLAVLMAPEAAMAVFLFFQARSRLPGGRVPGVCLSLREAGALGLAYLGFLPVLIGLLMGSGLLAGMLGVAPQPNPITGVFLGEESWGELAALAGVAVGVAPVCEEAFFRGLLYVYLRERTGPARAAVLSSALFAACHFNVVQFVPIMGMGLAMAWVFERTGKIAAPVLFHAANNAGAVAVVLFFKSIYFQ